MRWVKKILMAAAVAAVGISTASAGITLIEGRSNGVAQKYTQSCLDAAYKNAYGEVSGDKTSSDDFSNFRCYKDGKEIYCNEIFEDNQTERAKTDYFVSQLPDGLVCLSLPPNHHVYESTVEDCENIAYKNALCQNCGYQCDIANFQCYTDRQESNCNTVASDTATQRAEEVCTANRAKCNSPEYCEYGGTYNGETNACDCNPVPICSGPGGQCTYGGTPVGNGTVQCACNGAPNCNAICLDQGKVYGGSPKGNGTQECNCNEAPDCGAWCRANENKFWGGTPKGGGVEGCNCVAEGPDCSLQCEYDGEPLNNGTLGCSCFGEPNCNSPDHCPYGGTPAGGGTQACACNSRPSCRVASRADYDAIIAESDVTVESNSIYKNGVAIGKCLYGGAAKQDGSQDCDCLATPDCTSASACSYGPGTPKIDGTQACNCPNPPNCNLAVTCPYGGSPAGGGTQDCICESMPSCTYGAAGDGTQGCLSAPNCPACTYGGGGPKGDGTQACNDCNEPPNCPFCDYGGGGAKANGTQDCNPCNAEPVCSGADGLCRYGGSPKGGGQTGCACLGEPACPSCAYGGGGAKANGTQQCYDCNAAPNCNVLSICTYGGAPKADGTQGCSCYGKPNCNSSCKSAGKVYGGEALANGTQGCDCFTAPNCASQCTYGGTAVTY